MEGYFITTSRSGSSTTGKRLIYNVNLEMKNMKQSSSHFETANEDRKQPDGVIYDDKVQKVVR